MQKHEETLYKISADIPESQFAKLNQLAGITGKTKAELVRNAVDILISLYKTDLEISNTKVVGE